MDPFIINGMYSLYILKPHIIWFPFVHTLYYIACLAVICSHQHNDPLKQRTKGNHMPGILELTIDLVQRLLVKYSVHWSMVDRYKYFLTKNLNISWSKLPNAAKSCGMNYHIEGLVQERHNSIANALELCLSPTNPSIYGCNMNLKTWKHMIMP